MSEIDKLRNDLRAARAAFDAARTDRERREAELIILACIDSLAEAVAAKAA